MIDGRLFDKLEQLARMIRQVELPFGGIQLIVCGDFFQLPPVPDSLGSGQKIPVKFAFEAESWDTSVPNMIVLQTVFRQKDAGERHNLMYPPYNTNPRHEKT
jgi:ATP-dependent DNA helicase PIF1